MLTMDATPAPVPENIVVFVLATSVVRMKVNIYFTSSMVLKKIVYVTDCRVCTFSSCNWLINKIIHLTRYSFAAHAEYTAFSCRFKVNGTHLLRIARIVHLLGIIIRIVHSPLQRTGMTGWKKCDVWVTLQKMFTSINSRIIYFSFSFGFSEMIQVGFHSVNFVFFWSAGMSWNFFSVFFWRVWQRSVDGCIILMKGRNSFQVWTNFVYPTTVYPPNSAACL